MRVHRGCVAHGPSARDGGIDAHKHVGGPSLEGRHLEEQERRGEDVVKMAAGRGGPHVPRRGACVARRELRRGDAVGEAAAEELHSEDGEDDEEEEENHDDVEDEGHGP